MEDKSSGFPLTERFCPCFLVSCGFFPMQSSHGYPEYIEECQVNVPGEPAEVIKALHALQRLLPAISLQLNTAKSHFAYFHDAEAPLQHAALAALAERGHHGAPRLA